MILPKIMYTSYLVIAGGCCWWLLVMATSTTSAATSAATTIATSTSWLFSSFSHPFWTTAAEENDKNNNNNTGLAGGDDNDQPQQLAALLRPLLSDDAKVLLPGTPGFDQGTRTLAAKKPRLDLLVKVATAEDVQTTIRFSNEHDRPFLAISGGHGETWAKGRVQHGIGISTSGLAYVRVAADGRSATIGGGSKTGAVIRALWAQGKQAVTTACDCAGIVAPILGGGHGWLQGQHGLLADNLLAADLVLANGTALVASAASHPDLFWALRGAGHNFGVVTSVAYRIGDVPPAGENRSWAYEEYVFKHDRLEDLFGLANALLLRSETQTRPVELTHYAHFEHRAEVDGENPVIVFWLIWQGATTVPATFTTPVRALGPQSIRTGTTDITGLNAVAGAADGTFACQGDTSDTSSNSSSAMSAVMFGVSLRRWNVPGLRAALGVFGSLPDALQKTSIVLLEAWATNQVMAVPERSTVYPDRWNQVLMSPFFMYTPPLNNASNSNDEEVTIDDDLVAGYGARIRSALLQGSGQPLHAYVNYAHGDESLEAVYGYDAWRLRRLARLKAEYDPENRFGFYSPIPPHLDLGAEDDSRQTVV